MTVVYTLGKGSTWQNNELRYSIRSFVRYTAVNKIIVVGYLPDWLQGVEYVPFPDTPRKQFNIHAKTSLACQLVPEFVQAADDHFILQPTDFTMKYCAGQLKDKKFTGRYGEALANTIRHIGAGRYYNLHIPMLINSADYLRIMRLANWGEKEYLIKSLYANSMPQYKVTELPADVKVTKHLRRSGIEKFVEGKPCFSVSDAGLSTDMRRYLAELYPEKSKYER